MAGRVFRDAPAKWSPPFVIKADSDFDTSPAISAALAHSAKLHTPAYHLLVQPVTGNKTRGFWRARNNKAV